MPPPDRILLIRPSALGDVARTVPVLVTLRRAFPDAALHWLVVDAFADAIREHPALDAVVSFPRQRLARFGYDLEATRAGFAFARHLRDAEYGMVFDLQGLFRSGLLAWLTRCPRRVGFADARELAPLFYTTKHRVAGEGYQHTVDRMLGLLEAEGMSVSGDMTLHVDPEDAQWAEDFLADHAMEPGAFAALAPTARWGCKCWPMDRYAEVGRRLIADKRAGDRVLVLASPAERSRVAPLLEALGEGGVCPATTVGQLMALTARAAVLVCNDSAPLHLAVGLGRPIVALFGPTDPARVGPYGRPDAVLQPPGLTPEDLARYRKRRADNALIARLSLDTVWAKIDATLGGE